MKGLNSAKSLFEWLLFLLLGGCLLAGCSQQSGEETSTKPDNPGEVVGEVRLQTKPHQPELPAIEPFEEKSPAASGHSPLSDANLLSEQSGSRTDGASYHESARVQHKAAPGTVTHRMTAVDMAYSEPVPLPMPVPGTMPPGHLIPASMAPGDKFKRQVANKVVDVASQSVSTFAIDVDTGSYSLLRRYLQQGLQPPQGAVRTEELVNYFQYQPASGSRDGTFTLSSELATSPYNPGKHLLKVQLAGKPLAREQLPDANLVFLIDVSGSMRARDKLPLLQLSMTMLARQLRGEDRVSVITYAGHSKTLLDGVTGDSPTLVKAIQRLSAGGGTHGSAGIHDAYELATRHYIEGGINRVILATDGDFNLGVTDKQALEELIIRAKQRGVYLSVLGFGQGNLQEHRLEQLANKGNGHYAYIDNFSEGRKVLVEQLSSTLAVIAKDAKLQIEFNPAQVSEYRLIGYENRLLDRADFNNDKVDGGEVGAGHRVTALYELVLAGGQRSIDPLRYGTEHTVSLSDMSESQTLNQMLHQGFHQSKSADELAFIKLRYQPVEGGASSMLTHIVATQSQVPGIDKASSDMRFAAAVAGVGQLLNGGEAVTDADFESMIALANSALGQDTWGRRREFVQLAQLAAEVSQMQQMTDQGRHQVKQAVN